MAAGRYTAAEVALPVIPDMGGFFGELDSKLGSYAPKPITPKIKPEVEGDPESEVGEGSSWGAGAVAAAAAVGVAIGVALGAAIGDALDMSSAQGKLQAQLGGSAQYAGDMGKIAGRLYAGAYGDSLGGVNDALRAVLQSGALAEDAGDAAIESVTGKVLNLSTAFGVDATEGANALGQMMRTNMAPNADVALDVIYRGFQQGADKAGDFLDTLNEYSTQFRKVGIDGQTATGLITQGLQAGARDADLVADSIKEFAIRAVDGSKTTAEGFKALGLDGAEMARKIAAGGPEASGALDLVLDRLRGVKDPVAQSGAAVALFGTQAEDMGQALYALDPSSAAQALGTVGGAADAAGAALMTPAEKLESLRRTIQVSIVDFLSATVLPILGTLAGIAQAAFSWGPVPEILSFLFTVGGTIVGVVLAVVGAIKAWTVIQGIFNAVMAANPLSLMVIAIIGLVAAVIWAYANVGWFRDLVQGAFSLIGTVASWVWNSVLLPFFSWLGGALSSVGGFFTWLWSAAVLPAFNAIGAAASWLWSTILAPVLGFIGLALRVLGAIIFVVLVAPFVMAWNALAAIVSWAWSAIISPILSAIGTAFSWLYTAAVLPALNGIAAAANWVWLNILVPVGNGIMATLRFIGSVFTWLWANAVMPALNGIATAANWVWLNVLVPMGNGVMAVLRFVGSIFTWLWQNAVMPALNGIATVANWVWLNILVPMGNGIGAIMRGVGDAFGFAVNTIRDVWNRIQGIVKPPIDFVVNVVYNNGIRPAWNFIAGIFGLGLLPEMRFARGGLVPGEDRGYDYVPALLRGGEGVLVPGAVDALGGPRALEDLNRRAEPRAGFAHGGTVGRDGVARFADGGFLDSFNGVGLTDLITDPAGAVKRAFGIDTKGGGGVGQLSEAIGRFPGKVADLAWQKIKDLVSGLFASGGGGGGGAERWAGVVQLALGMLGQPQGLVPTVLRRMNQESGGDPAVVNRWDSNWQKGTPSVGLMQVIGPTYRSHADPRRNVGPYLYGTSIDPLSNILAGMRYSISRYGSMAAGFNKAGGYDSGGYLPPGWSMAFNGTGKNEPVIPADDLHDTLRNGGGGGGQSLQVLAREPMTTGEIQRLASELQRRQDWDRRNR